MKRGFTLIEVLLAVVILSIGLTVLLTGATRCLAVMKIARTHQTAMWTLGMGEAEHPMTATNHISDLEVNAVRYPNGFTYSRIVEDDEDEDGLYVVRSRAAWSERNREAAEEIVSYVMFLKKDE